MKIRTIFHGCGLLFIGIAMSACHTSSSSDARSIIPQPNEVKSLQGSYTLTGSVQVALPENEGAQRVFNYLQGVMKRTAVSVEPVDASADAPMRLLVDPALPSEAYRLLVNEKGIEIASDSTGAGWFYGVQSLLQLMPAALYAPSAHELRQIDLPATEITDAPRFPHRGAMMDVARNFLPKEEVLKFIDLMAFYKMNRFHFHITDDQGWRIEIKKYPRLVEVGSHRPRTIVGHSDYYFPFRYDNREQRGYYTQDEIREIVRYAADRFITVIPEIEMPGHSSAALAAYPELSCGLGKTYVVRDYFDVFDEVYCPREGTFKFLEDVLTEVMELFPSHYIHIGGDECPKKAWKACAHCQNLIRKHNLKDEDGLQSWFIQRIERFLNEHGRDIIGWDEILQGGLAPNATVMSWRGEIGGIEAAQQNHAVIMTPTQYCYFDYYQAAPHDEPVAMGGLLQLDSVYLYNPLPPMLTPEQQTCIIGTQANIWGEYTQTSEYFEYLAFPRLLAMAEVQWTQPERKDFAHFCRRLDREFTRLEARNVNACRNFYEANSRGAWNSEANRYEVTLSTYCPDAEIRYAVNDTVVTPASPLYTSPLALDSSAVIAAAVFRDGRAVGRTRRYAFNVSLASGAVYQSEPAANGNENQQRCLTDGLMGSARDMHNWAVFVADTLQLTFQLPQSETVSSVSAACVWRSRNDLWPVPSMQVEVSADGKRFETVGNKTFKHDLSHTVATRYPISVSFAPVEARYVRIRIPRADTIPVGFYHEGHPAEIGIDEVEIR